MMMVASIYALKKIINYYRLKPDPETGAFQITEAMFDQAMAIDALHGTRPNPELVVDITEAFDKGQPPSDWEKITISQMKET